MSTLRTLTILIFVVALDSPVVANQSIQFVITSAPPEMFRFANDPNEMSVGYDTNTNTTLVQIFTETATITWNQTSWTPTWHNVAPLIAEDGISNDPIGYLDQTTNRYFNVQLLASTSCSTLFITNDDGKTWLPTEPPCSTPGIDHETIGAGPYHSPLPQGIVYPNIIYYCSQQGILIGGNGLSYCTTSYTGGLTWNSPVPMNLLECYPLHGQVQISPDGTAFVPHKQCGSTLGVLRSENNGLTWQEIHIPNTLASFSDPQIRFSPNGTLWYAGISGATEINNQTGVLVVLSSTDDGNTWSNPVSISRNENAEFPMLAVNNNDVAVAWYGTNTSGDDQDPNFVGTWYVYAAFSSDGISWSTVQITPSPVQQGPICLKGTSCMAIRNLLDFQETTMDSNGRFIIAYADGCHPSCSSHSSWATIAQET